MESWLSTDAEGHVETDAPLIPVHTLSFMDQTNAFLMGAPGAHHALGFTLGLFLSISRSLLLLETHFHGASRCLHPEEPGLVEMLADSMAMLP